MSAILDNINPKHFDEVFSRIQKNAIKKEKELIDRLNRYKELQKKHENLIMKGYNPMTLGGDYLFSIKNTEENLQKHIQENLEFLI
jgi:hypothetical protein